MLGITCRDTSHAFDFGCALVRRLSRREIEPRVSSRGFEREFSKDEAKAVAVAKAELEKKDHKSIDAIYRVTVVPEGYSVQVEYVADRFFWLFVRSGLFGS
jgi:hypothetical protein